MRRLEDLAGVKLFEKAGRNIQLTEGGLVLLEYARRLLALNDEAVQAVAGLKVRGKIRLGLLQDFAEAILPSALASFSRAHPAVRVRGGGSSARPSCLLDCNDEGLIWR